jgi:hypothetical protein
MTMTEARLDRVDYGTRLVELDADAGVVARLIGGVAIWSHAPVVRRAPFARAHEDVDIVVPGSGRRAVDAAARFSPDAALNTVNGRERRCYFGPAGEKVDVFIGHFQMCHTLPLEDRMHIDEVTVPLAELFLSKAQIYELNRKDALDMLALLLDHDVASGDDDVIKAARIGELCRRDWGLWRTTTRSLQTLGELLDVVELAAGERETIRGRLGALRDALNAAPKSMKWKTRDRVPWYELPEDPDRGSRPA